jgi:protein involved in polysaccharide export with SLBB domain
LPVREGVIVVNAVEGKREYITTRYADYYRDIIRRPSVAVLEVEWGPFGVFVVGYFFQKNVTVFC